MRAIIFGGKQQVHIERIPDPIILAPSDAIVRIDVTAICGSDLHPYHERERGLDHGTVMGHEFAGEVVEVGTEVSGVRVGDRVTSPFTTSCGRCFYCDSGLTGRCIEGELFGWIEQGRGLHGSQAELVRVPLADTTLFRVPEEVVLDEAIFLGDIFATGSFCADLAGVSAGGAYAIIGCGPVGIMTLIAALRRGAERIWTIDGLAERLMLARSFGGTPLNYRDERVVDLIIEATGGRGVDAVMEVVGSSAAERLAMDIVRPGGTIAVGGVHTDATFSFSPVEAYNKNLTYRVGRCPARVYMERLLPALAEDGVDFGRIVSHRLPLEDGPRGYELFDRKLEGCTKVLLYPSSVPQAEGA